MAEEPYSVNGYTLGLNANLEGANLEGCDLRGANLYNANLQEANLTGCDLRGADLRSAYLYKADLRGANLTGCDITDANLSNAQLENSCLENIRTIATFTLCKRLCVIHLSPKYVSSFYIKILYKGATLQKWRNVDFRHYWFRELGYDEAHWDVVLLMIKLLKSKFGISKVD